MNKYISRDYINMLEGLGTKYMDQNSSVNQEQFNRYRQFGADAAATNALQGMRLGAMGQNPFANEQYQSNLANANNQAMGAWRSGLSENRQLGATMLNTASDLQYKNSMIKLQRDEMAKQLKAYKQAQLMGMIGTVGGGLLGTLLSPMGQGDTTLLGKWLS